MDIVQVHEIVNGISTELLGESAVVAENLGNIVDIGKQIFDNVSYDKYVKTLVDHVGRVWFVNRTLEGVSNDLYRDDWEYGAVMEKIYGTELPEAVENETWELVDKASYDPNVFNRPAVAAKFFNKKTTFEVDLSIGDIQARSAFSTGAQLNSFFSMLTNDVDKSLTVKTDALAERTINNMILQTFNSEFPNVVDNDYSGMTGVKAVNLMKLYNDTFGESITAASALYIPEFIRFASMIINRYMIRLRKISSLFNVGALPRFTPSSMQHIVLHGDFTSAANSYLQSDTFHDEFTALPRATEVPYWQGSGLDYSFASTSAIKGVIELANGNTKTIEVSGILGVIFDHDAMGITNMNKRVTSNYNAKAEFTNYFYKVDASYFNDLNESMVVFYIA